MLESRQMLSSLSERLPRAFLLSEHFPSQEDRNLAALLDFFGVPWTCLPMEELSQARGASSFRNGKASILSSASRFAAAIREVQRCGGALPEWIQTAGSVYLYGFQETPDCHDLLRFLTQDLQGTIRHLDTPRAVISVTPDLSEMCGPLSGIHALANLAEGDRFFDLHHPVDKIQPILSVDQGMLFFGVECGGVRFYLSASSNVVDLQRPVTNYFDVKDCFCGAVPLAMYLKWACGNSCWKGGETSACLIVDDPLLRSRYGFLNFPEAIQLMDKENFATTIGFIPWNWRRTDPSTVQMFRQRSDRVSVSVHGCDHTAAEFATHSEGQLNTRVKTARKRMEHFRERTSLLYDQVMIFPQGAFSPETGHVLKLNGFAAAVNTEVAPVDHAGNETRIIDVWDLAIMKYGSFPIFTRRYLAHGIENFAFDQLLGKPCFIVAHHDAFRDHAHDLIEFIAKLNSLNGTLHWRSLGDAIDHSFRTIHHDDGTDLIQVYATSAVIENSSNTPRDAFIVKRESDPGCVKAVTVNQRPVDYFSEEKYLQFRVSLPPSQATRLHIHYADRLATDSHRLGVAYNTKALLRRYLSEFRDNYLSHSDLLTRTAARATHRVASRQPQNPA